MLSSVSVCSITYLKFRISTTCCLSVHLLLSRIRELENFSQYAKYSKWIDENDKNSLPAQLYIIHYQLYIIHSSPGKNLIL